jgi:hypothetical protein
MPPRDLTVDEMSQLIDEGLILNEQGVPLLTRWMAKLFSANPTEARKFLERQGYEVTPVSTKFKLQFAVRSPLDQMLDQVEGMDKSKPTLLDPEGFELADIVDLAFDIFVAGPIIAQFGAGGAVVGSGAGPVGTGLGGVIGTGTGSAAAETLRQGIGQLAGVNQAPDLGAIGSAAVFGSILPTIFQRISRFPVDLLRMGRFSNKKANNIGRNLASRVAGTSEEEITTAAASASRTQKIVSESASAPIELLDKIRGRIKQLRSPEHKFPESVEIEYSLSGQREWGYGVHSGSQKI